MINIEEKYGVDILAFSKNKHLYQSDPSFIYRCMNLASVLKNKGMLNYIGHYKDYKPNLRTRFILLHRPVYSFSFELLIRRLKYKNIKIIADVDDLIIHPDFSGFSPAVLNNVLSEKKISKQFHNNYKALKLCDHIVCSTEELKDHLAKYFNSKSLTVIHNCIFHNWKSGIRNNEHKKKIITYFPGTKSHDRDFQTIQKPLEAFLGDTPDASLNVVGPLNTSLRVAKSQLTFSDKVPFKDYEFLVRKSDINLAPLENSIFNQCKSALKAIEASAFGIPTIFSPNRDANRFLNTSTLIAKTDDDWYNFLKSLHFDVPAVFDNMLCHEQVLRESSIKGATEKFCVDVLDLNGV